MNKVESKSPLDTQQEQKMSDEEVVRRKAARQALLQRVAKQPTMNLGKWTRDEGYE